MASYAMGATSTASTQNASTAQPIITKKNDLDKMSFLKLLVTQLQNQDPMSPMEDTAFISQLATFSSLEQQTSTNESLSSVSKSQAATQAFAMIGSNIEYTSTNQDGVMSGKVESVSFVDGMPVLNVGTGKVNVSDVIKVY